MRRTKENRYVPDDTLKVLGLVIAGFGPLVVAGVLVPFRDDSIVSSNVALVFVLVVVLAAAAGGAGSGVTAAVVSTFSFDFFFTHPYQSLKINDVDDVGTAVLLLVIGLVVAWLVGFAHESRKRSERAEDDSERVHRVAELAAGGVPIDELTRAVETELSEMLSLRECRYDPTSSASELPTIARNGSVQGGSRRWMLSDLSLPAEGAEIRVLGRGRDLGRIVLIADPDVGVSIQQRRFAVALSDQLGAALVADNPRAAAS
jgi:K+-sensing histidine kinase KdpD